MSHAWDLIDGILEQHAPEEEMRTGWRCLRETNLCRRAADDPVWEGRPFVPLTGSGTAYIELAATVEWSRGFLHLTRQDWKTGAADRSWDIRLDPATLEALHRAKWPEPGERPWF